MWYSHVLIVVNKRLKDKAVLKKISKLEEAEHFHYISLTKTDSITSTHFTIAYAPWENKKTPLSTLNFSILKPTHT